MADCKHVLTLEKRVFKDLLRQKFGGESGDAGGKGPLASIGRWLTSAGSKGREAITVLSSLPLGLFFFRDIAFLLTQKMRETTKQSCIAKDAPSMVEFTQIPCPFISLLCAFHVRSSLNR